MTRVATALVMLVSVIPAAAQTLTLDEALAMAARMNPEARAAAAAADEARADADAARTNWWPTLTLHESWQRGNQPVFAFSSLLAQRQFTAANFAVASLNHPDPIDNFRAAAGIHQPILDLAATSGRTAQAAASALAAGDAHRGIAADAAMRVAHAYGEVIRATAEARAAEGAVIAARSARDTASARRDAGTATQADLLAFEVHLAQMDARRIRAGGDALVARATLNRLLGRPLDTSFDIVAPDEIAAAPAEGRVRPEVAAAANRLVAAEAADRAARAAWLPVVSADGGWEWNGGRWNSRAASWVAGVQAAWTWSVGGAETSHVRAADAARDQARAERDAAEAQGRLDLFTATIQLETARARRVLAAAAVRQATESQRIIRDRYGAGMATATDVLIAAQALVDAESLAGAANAELAVAAVALRRAQGTL